MMGASIEPSAWMIAPRSTTSAGHRRSEAVVRRGEAPESPAPHSSSSSLQSESASSKAKRVEEEARVAPLRSTNDRNSEEEMKPFVSRSIRAKVAEEGGSGEVEGMMVTPASISRVEPGVTNSGQTRM